MTGKKDELRWVLNTFHTFCCQLIFFHYNPDLMNSYFFIHMLWSCNKHTAVSHITYHYKE